jgi:hypothetical protein
MSRNGGRPRISCRDGRRLSGYRVPGVNIRVYVLVSNESKERMSRPEIRREDLREPRHITGRMVLEHVHI